MKNKGIIILVAVVALLFGGMLIFKATRKNIDWGASYINKDTNPYGTYIAYNLLEDIFDEVEMTRKPVYNRLKGDWVEVSDYDDLNYGYDHLEEEEVDYEYMSGEDEELLLFDIGEEPDLIEVEDVHSAYVFINQSFDIDKLDLEYLLDYVDDGNDVFISAERISALLLDTLKLKLNYSYSQKDQDTIFYLKDYPEKEYCLKNLMRSSSFTPDSAFVLPMDVLGYNNGNDSVFVRVPFGAGNIYLHTVPVAFTNYYQISPDNYDYAYRCLSYIPKNTFIIWDEYQTQGGVFEDTDSPLLGIYSDTRIILSFLVAIMGFLIFMLFRAKRIQRIIPVINKPANSSIEFLETVSNLYYRKKDFTTIVEKRHAYFLDYVRRHFYLPTEVVDEEFVETLSAKSGVEVGRLNELFKLYREMMISPTYISNSIFLKYSELLEIFYKTVKN